MKKEWGYPTPFLAAVIIDARIGCNRISVPYFALTGHIVIEGHHDEHASWVIIVEFARRVALAL